MVLPQDELRRRIRVVMALKGISSWEKLAAATGYSRSLLKDLGTPRGVAQRKHLMSIAQACEVDFAWFEVEDLDAAVAAAGVSDPATRFEDAAGEVRQRRQEKPPRPWSANSDPDEVGGAS